MKTGAIVTLAALAVCASAHPPYLTGTVGSAPVFLDLDLDQAGGKVSGWYYYLRVGKQIRLDGTIDAKGRFLIVETDYNTNTKTGSFEGTAAGARWTGTWRNAKGGGALPFALEETRDALASTTAPFRCVSIVPDRKYGFTYTHSLDLTLAKGEVKALDVSRAVKSRDGDEQSCSISLSDLKREKTGEGVLLRARADNPGDASAPHCTVRIIGAGDWLVVNVGDAGDSGNDCRQAGDAMFCSPRAMWTDLIVNRKAQTCRPVQ